MKYPYKQTPLPAGAVEWLPVLPVRVALGPLITSPFEAIVDSGAFACLFHGDIARAVGIADITSGTARVSGGVVKNTQMMTFAHKIQLLLGTDILQITGYFADDLPIACLLGRNGFFDNYVITFDPRRESSGLELVRCRQ